MTWSEAFFSAFALMLVFEGIMPFLSPERWRDYLSRILAFDDKIIRYIGLGSMLIGVAILYIVHWVF